MRVLTNPHQLLWISSHLVRSELGEMIPKEMIPIEVIPIELIPIESQ